MPFRLDRQTNCEIFTRTDIMNLLNCLEPSSQRSGFEQGWLEGLHRLGIAYGIRYEIMPPTPRLIDAPSR